MIDKQSILKHANLLTLAGHDTDLGGKPIATTGSGEYAGACPFCGGRDRFRVQPNRQPWGLWMCRYCTDGKWQNAIDYVIRRDNCDFKTACTNLAGGDLPTTREQRPAPEIPPYKAPDSNWQDCAWRVIETCHENLWQPQGGRALDYLLSRGLAEPAIKHFMLGYNPINRKVDGYWLDRGITIPCIVAGEIWYVKVRRPLPSSAKDKYRCMAGSRPVAIFNADDLVGAEAALFVEGEIDAMTAWQEFTPCLSVATLGSASNHPDLATWGAYLLSLKTILVTYDHDDAGIKGASFWTELGAQVCPMPDGVKDINDFRQAGGDLREWLKNNLEICLGEDISVLLNL